LIRRHRGPVAGLLSILVAASALSVAPAQAVERGAPTRLSGHVLPALPSATRVGPAGDMPAVSPGAAEPLTLTLVLAREDQHGFDDYLRRVYDRGSPDYRRFLTQGEIADRYGPSRRSYRRVLRWLEAKGFTLVEGSANRMTLTVRAPRAAVERALRIEIGEYRIGETRFFANDRDPALPAHLASSVASISGLSSLATPRPQSKAIAKTFVPLRCWLEVNAITTADEKEKQRQYDACVQRLNSEIDSGSSSSASAALVGRAAGAPGIPFDDLDGSGQTVGLTAFDRFELSDVADYLALTGEPESRISQVHRVAVNGGALPGPDQAEVLLDINAVMTLAPGAEFVVYDAPFAGLGVSFQGLFNAMIADGVDIISNSWAYCENQTTLADVQSIEAILQTAAASGISVFTASGDTGSTCLNGSPNTVAVPASSPSITAVGGTSRVWGPGFLYESESWWDGSDDTPPTGRGGFGTSRFFARPAYQDGLHSGPMRSVPDVSFNSDPAIGVVLCQAAAGGCPTQALWGGTSIAAPQWAGMAALLNQAHGSNLGNFNELLYPLAGTDAFHGPAELGSDFAHVGLGSPNLNLLKLALEGETAGPVDAVESSVIAYVSHAPFTPLPAPSVAADGVDAVFIVVRLRDVDGNQISGKTVSLEADSTDVIIDPPSAVTDVANGAAVFTVTTLTPETVTFTATDVSDGIELAEDEMVVFAVPPAASGGINAFPTSVPANGVSTTTITVTLQDALGRPTPGKTVTLSQGAGHSVITGPNPSVTDVNGQIQFTATNRVNEVVTYTAVDVSDGDLPVPGSAQVTFTGASTSCVNPNPPTGDNGYVVTPFATGFVAENFFFGNVNWGGCPGASFPGFLGPDVYIANFRTGALYQFGIDGGAVSSANILATHGPTFGWPVVGQDGRLYGAFGAGSGGFTQGSVVELDPSTGAIVRTLASNQRCPTGLAVDPLSGDLFFTHQCFGAGSDDPSIHRVRDPGGPTPTVEVYATLPVTPNGMLAFAPNGTLYAAGGYTQATPPVFRIDGTDQPAPPAVTTVTGVTSIFTMTIGEVGPDGEAQSLIGLTNGGLDLELFDLTTMPPTRTVIAHDLGGGVIGPDGCMYTTRSDTVYKVARDDGSCAFNPTTALPSLTLTPAEVTPDPLQGTAHVFTAKFHNLDVPEGTPIFFQVSGANPDIRMERTNGARGAHERRTRRDSDPDGRLHRRGRDRRDRDARR
jgi:kumamolisin